MLILRLNNSRNFGFKDAQFIGYYIDMNTNTYGDFQICINVPLTYYLVPLTHHPFNETWE